MQNSEINDIINYPHYFSAGEMEFGIDGPELVDGKLYISIYHYLEYSQLGPRNYNTFALGQYLTERANHFVRCKYKSQSFSINKFDLDLIETELVQFNRFRN